MGSQATPALQDDLRIRWVHAIAARIGVPTDQVTPRHPPHDLVRPGHDARERGAGPLAIALRQIRVEHQCGVARGKLRHLAKEPPAVDTADGIEDFAELPPPKVGLIGRLLLSGIARLMPRSHHPAPGKGEQLLLGIRLELDPWHL
jgi:hypothetical protein